MCSTQGHIRIRIQQRIGRAVLALAPQNLSNPNSETITTTAKPQASSPPGPGPSLALAFRIQVASSSLPHCIPRSMVTTSRGVGSKAGLRPVPTHKLAQRQHTSRSGSLGGPRVTKAATAAAGGATALDDFAQDSRPVILFDGVCNL